MCHSAALAGDIYACAIEERIFGAALIEVGTFSYAMFFANITTYVAESGLSNAEFEHEQKAVTDYINLHKMPQRIQQDVAIFYDYLWSRFKGIDETSLLHDVPDSLRTEVLLLRYKHMMKQVWNGRGTHAPKPHQPTAKRTQTCRPSSLAPASAAPESPKQPDP